MFAIIGIFCTEWTVQYLVNFHRPHGSRRLESVGGAMWLYVFGSEQLPSDSFLNHHSHHTTADSDPGPSVGDLLGFGPEAVFCFLVVYEFSCLDRSSCIAVLSGMIVSVLLGLVVLLVASDVAEENVVGKRTHERQNRINLVRSGG